MYEDSLQELDPGRGEGVRVKKHMNLASIVSPDLKSSLEKAAEFHGHLGPFLTIGVRMGLIGLKKMGKCNNNELAIDASLPLHIPFSCIIDGLQVTTHCTVGNRKLSLKDSDSIQVKFKKEKARMEVIITLNKSILEKIMPHLLKEATTVEEIRRLAWIIAGISRDELFEIS